MTDINLLPPKNILNEAQQKTRRFISRAFITASLFTLMALAITLGTSLYYSNKLASAQELNEQLKQTYSQKSEKSQKIYLTHKKISGIETVLAKRQLQSKNLEAIVKFLPPGITVNTITLDSQGNISLSLQAKDLATLEDLTAAISSKTGSNIFKNLVMSGLRMDKNGGFNFSLGGTIIKDKINTNEQS